MVAGDHGDFPLMVAVFRQFLGLFQFFSSCIFLTFSLIYWFDFFEENLTRSRANQRTKFSIFGKAEDFVADFSPRVETRSNDIEMT